MDVTSPSAGTPSAGTQGQKHIISLQNQKILWGVWGICVISPAAEDFDDAITEDSPCSPGLSLYAITKACGHVCTQVFAANTPGLKVLKVIFNGFFNVEDGPTDNMHGGGPGGDTPTMSIS